MVPTDVMVSARDLSLEYRSQHGRVHPAVRGVTLHLAAGEILGVMGESGAGKSTLVRAIAGQFGSRHRGDGWPQLCGGRLEVFGTRLRNGGRRTRDRTTLRVGLLRQDGADRLNPVLTVGENVAEPIFERDRRFSPREAANAVATAVDAVRLPLGLLNRLPHQLSSGQRQRVALARALVFEPRLLVADEPTRGVDASVRDEVLGAIRDQQRERGLSAIVVSSDLEVLARIAPRIAVMQHGLVVGLGDLDSLITAPENDYLKGLARLREAVLRFPSPTASNSTSGESR